MHTRFLLASSSFPTVAQVLLESFSESKAGSSPALNVDSNREWCRSYAAVQDYMHSCFFFDYLEGLILHLRQSAVPSIFKSDFADVILLALVENG